MKRSIGKILEDGWRGYNNAKSRRRYLGRGLMLIEEDNAKIADNKFIKSWKFSTSNYLNM